ncbi:hypothetical protein VUJ46_04595 [Chryseobacterium sp. MYb264]|uniref:hypothetical protein n=1 Tax=Chryseobacterium sp. MYb264 TaxID=2745153 RepID=UPI002E10FDED|nr:hypothetical protein VUJ46_04595 [Chryseobacterium sp. MYb264]
MKNVRKSLKYLKISKIFVERFLVFSFIFLFIFACKEDKALSNHKKETIRQEVKTWQDGFGLTHVIDIDSIWKKPVRYYVSNKNCDSTALKFYLGVYKPTDEPETERLLNLVTTKNDSLRPFYRWILDKTIIIQDGALGEYTGTPARMYAEKFPKEFFEYMDSDMSGKKYSDWCSSIGYSGFYNSENFDEPEMVKTKLIKVMSENCADCNERDEKRIIKFANDCFSNQ